MEETVKLASELRMVGMAVYGFCPSTKGHTFSWSH